MNKEKSALERERIFLYKNKARPAVSVRPFQGRGTSVAAGGFIACDGGGSDGPADHVPFYPAGSGLVPGLGDYVL